MATEKETKANQRQHLILVREALGNFLSIERNNENIFNPHVKTLKFPFNANIIGISRLSNIVSLGSSLDLKSFCSSSMSSSSNIVFEFTD